MLEKKWSMKAGYDLLLWEYHFHYYCKMKQTNKQTNMCHNKITINILAICFCVCAGFSFGKQQFLFHECKNDRWPFFSFVGSSIIITNYNDYYL